MKNVQITMCIVAVVLCAWSDNPAPGDTADRPAGEGAGSGADEQSGELILYARRTMIGTVAERVFRDGSGKITKTILYRPRIAASEPVSASFTMPYKGDIQPVRVVIHKYDKAGRETRTEYYTPDMKLRRILETSYHSDGTRKSLVSRNSEGIRTHEQRYSRTHGSLLYFDDTGKKLIGMRGTVPKDIHLAYGHGTTTDGLAYAIGPSKESGHLDDILIYSTVLNKGAGSAKVVNALQYRALKMELRDEDGNLVPQDTAYIEKRDKLLMDSNRHFREGFKTIPPGQAESFGTHELREWYSNLKPGNYQLTVRRRASGKEFSLVSNTISITIEAPKVSEPAE